MSFQGVFLSAIVISAVLIIRDLDVYIHFYEAAFGQSLLLKALYKYNRTKLRYLLWKILYLWESHTEIYLT